MFTNALRTHSRLRVLTATRVTIPATRSINSLVAFRTAVPKNVSLCVSRSFTTSQVTRNELKDGASSAAPGDTPIDPLSENQKVVDVDGASSAASGDAPSNTTSARNELEDGASSAASVDAPTNTVSANEVEDGASSAAPEDAPTNTVSASNDASSAVLEDAPSNTIFVGNVAYIATEEDLKNTFAKFGEVIRAKIHISQNFRPRGTCHIDFANKESAVATMKWTAQNSLNLYGRKLRVEYSLGDSREPPRDPNFSLHFSGCTGEESEVRNIFQQFSDSIVDIFLMKDPRSGNRTKSGFIHFNTIENATKAMEALNGTKTPDGNDLTVNFARPRPPKRRRSTV